LAKSVRLSAIGDKLPADTSAEAREQWLRRQLRNTEESLQLFRPIAASLPRPWPAALRSYWPAWRTRKRYRPSSSVVLVLISTPFRCKVTTTPGTGSLGSQPHTPRGCIAQAWAVAAVGPPVTACRRCLR
jgi:hypothetical protein